MTKLLTDRIRLIRGLQAAQRNGFSESEKATIAKIITTIRNDPDQQFLSYSQEELCKISYASSPLHRIDSVRRLRTLPRYIRYIRVIYSCHAFTIDIYCRRHVAGLSQSGSLPMASVCPAKNVQKMGYE